MADSSSPSGLYPTVDVTGWMVVRAEAVGADEKYWLSPPGSDERWLFKANNAHVRDGHAWSQREDLAEKVAGELAALGNVPAAKIELAQRGDRRGCISRDLLPGSDWELQMGAVLLDGIVEGYVPGSELSNKLRIGHSLANIRRALNGFGAPADSSVPPSFDGFDVFAGYVTFDAVVANRDRHDQNWAVLRSLKDASARTICGSFDHGRALGSALLPDAMAREIGLGIERFATRGTAWRFEHAPGSMQTLVELASDALAMVRPEVRAFWLDSVSRLTDSEVARITERLPADVSGTPRTFMREVVAVNRRRVLDGC